MSQLLVIDGVSVRRDLDGRYCLNDLHRVLVVKSVINHQLASLSQTRAYC
jgi:hypothetical protein